MFGFALINTSLFQTRVLINIARCQRPTWCETLLTLGPSTFWDPWKHNYAISIHFAAIFSQPHIKWGMWSPHHCNLTVPPPLATYPRYQSTCRLEENELISLLKTILLPPCAPEHLLVKVNQVAKWFSPAESSCRGSEQLRSKESCPPSFPPAVQTWIWTLTSHFRVDV